MTKLKTITLDLTEQCNLNCSYCFTFSDHKKKVMSEPMAKKIVDWFLGQADEKEQLEISFWGGEPLLEWDLLKTIVSYADKEAENLGLTIGYGGTTNGVLYTPDKVEWTNEHNSLFLVSLDGVEMP